MIAWRKTGYGEWMLWMVGNEFYYVETMKMECNWKSNWIVSSMETKKLTKPPRKLVDNSSLFLKTNNFQNNCHNLIYTGIYLLKKNNG